VANVLGSFDGVDPTVVEMFKRADEVGGQVPLDAPLGPMVAQLERELLPDGEEFPFKPLNPVAVDPRFRRPTFLCQRGYPGVEESDER
jgi:hypothetical protein